MDEDAETLSNKHHETIADQRQGAKATTASSSSSSRCPQSSRPEEACPFADSVQFVKQSLCFFQVGGIEAFCKPAIDWSKEITGFAPLALFVPETREAGRCA